MASVGLAYSISNNEVMITGIGTCTDTNLVIPTTINGYPVTKIGNYVFQNQTGLISVTIPASVTSIGSGAFLGCAGLTSVTIKNGVKTIYNYAFGQCTGLTSITIPDSVTGIDAAAFYHCSSLRSITVPFVGASRNSTSIPHFGYIFGASSYSDNSNYIPSLLRTVVITDCTSIGSHAFHGCTGLTSITIPDSVTSIGYYAFKGCSSLESITIPVSVTSIGDSAFQDCTSLTLVMLPAGLWKIGDSAFQDCTSLTRVLYPNGVVPTSSLCHIPETVTSIGEKAFQGCTGLVTVVLGSSVTSIGMQAFYGCSGLASLRVYSNTTYRIENNCIINKSDNQLILGCKNSVIPSSVTSIGQYAFGGCTGLTSMTIPSSVTSIGQQAFGGCTGLTSVSFATGSRLTSIGQQAFQDCTSLTSITIPSSMTRIDASAFQDCTGLASITIPSSVTSIGASAFQDCTGLASITIPSSVTSIGDSAFQDCTSLTSITIPSSVTDIRYSVFQGCTGLISATIRAGVTSIWVSAFEGCTGLTSITIPDSVTEIQSSAFRGCSSLESITIPFVGNSKSATGAAPYTLFGYIFGSSSYTGGTETKQYYTSSRYDTYYIPTSLRTVTVTGGNILDGAFYDCSMLTSITIPDSVTSIGMQAFYGCSGLTSIMLPEGLGSIGNSAFARCSNIATVDYDGTEQQWNAITKGSGWDNNLGANVPGGYIILFGYKLDYSLNAGGTSYTVTGIGMVTDTDLVIRSTYKGKPVIAISAEAFKNCTSLTSAFIPSSVTSIGTSAFSGCSALTTVRIPDNSGLQSIGFNAFFNNTALTFITLPNSLSNIGGDVFNGSTNLTKIYYYGSQTDWNNITKNANWKRNTNSNLEVIYQSVGLAYELQQDSTYAVTGKGTCQDTILTIPMEHLGVPVTLIKTNAFYENQDITFVTILDNLRVIGTSAFQGCHSLETAIIGNNVTTIGQSAFADNIHLYKVQLGSSLNTINDSAFINCYRLVEVVNNSTLNVDKNSANGSVGLYSKKIWTNDETYESKLSNNNNFILYKKDDNTYSLIDYVGDAQNPNLNSLNLSEINNYGLYQNVIITQLELPATVTTIQDKAFGDCDSLTEVRINEGTKIINNEAFEKCDALSMIYLPSTLISIGDYAFDEFNGAIKYNDTANKWDLVQKGNLALGPEAKIYALASATTNTRKDFIGEYRGFTFGKTNNGIYDDNCHSSYYGIVRTSSSNRYEDKLNGTLKENTQSRTNADGTIYFGTNITQRQFTVNFAFDSMTESQLLSMKKWLNPKEIKDLIFDEDNPLYSTDELNDDNYILVYGTPNNRIQKIWKAKVTGQTSVKHLCFDENHQRIYKGDGSIQFTCYYPYALGTKLESPANGTILVKSDLEVPFIWSGGFSGIPALPKGQKYSLKINDNEVASITLNKEVSGDGGGYAQSIEWNSEKGLVYLVQSMDGVEKNRIILPISGNSLFKLQPNFEYGVYDEDTSCIGRISYIPRYL